MTSDPLEILTGTILKCAFKVHNTLGPGFFEKVYENALVIELRKAGLNVQQQVPLKVYYDGIVVGDYVADLLVEEKVVIENKATDKNPPIHVTQTINSITCTRMPVGMLLNFGDVKLYYRRLTLRHGGASNAVA